MSSIAAAPAITVNGKTTVDFGSYPANESKVAKFQLTNQGDVPLHIGNIRKTCGCSEARIDKKLLSPGATTVFEATIKAESISGPYVKAIYVESDDPRQRFLRLTLAGNAVPLIKVLPRDNLYLGSLATGKNYHYSFNLDVTRNNVKTEIHSVKANFPIKTALQRKPEPEKGYLLFVTVSPDASASEKEPSLDLNAEIKIKITEPAGWAPIKITLQGRRVINNLPRDNTAKAAPHVPAMGRGQYYTASSYLLGCRSLDPPKK